MKTRVIAAFALLPLLLIVMLAFPKIVAMLLLSSMAAVASWELLAGTGIVKMPRLCLYTALMAFWSILWSTLGIQVGWLVLGVMVFWCLLFMEVMLSGMKLPFQALGVCFAGGLVVPFLLGSIGRIYMTENGRALALIPFAVAFLSDSGAYFGGMFFGKHKLAPEISPKKTVEGVFGGIIGAIAGLLIFFLVLQFFFGYTVNYWFVLLYAILGSLGGVFGDLCFSVIKRQTGIKDYGNLIPGHGGILDRFDSMMVVGPLVEVLLLLLPVAVK